MIYFIGSALTSTAITVFVGTPVSETFTIKDDVSSLFGIKDGTTYCGNLASLATYVFRDAGTATDIIIGTVTATGTTASISFDPDITQGGIHNLDLFAILNGVESLLFSNIVVTVSGDCSNNYFIGSALTSTAITVVYGTPITATFTIIDYISSMFGNLDGTTYCGN